MLGDRGWVAGCGITGPSPRQRSPTAFRGRTADNGNRDEPRTPRTALSRIFTGTTGFWSEWKTVAVRFYRCRNLFLKLRAGLSTQSQTFNFQRNVANEVLLIKKPELPIPISSVPPRRPNPIVSARTRDKAGSFSLVHSDDSRDHAPQFVRG